MNLNQIRSAFRICRPGDLVLSTAVHVATALDLDVYSRFPFVSLLHLVAIGLFGLFVLAGGYRLKLDDVTSRLPVWALAAVAATVAYVVVNTLVCAGLSGEGNASVLQGQYVLVSHGQIYGACFRRRLSPSSGLRTAAVFWDLGGRSYLVPAIYFFRLV